MEDKMFLSPKVHSSVRDHPAHMIPELLACHERAADPFQTSAFVAGELVWIGRIDRGKIDVQERVGNAVYLDRSRLVVYPVQEAAMLHFPLGMARNHLPFQFELHNCRRLLHAGHHALLAHASSFGLEMDCRIVCVDSSRKQIEGLHRNPVALLQLHESTIAQGNA